VPLFTLSAKNAMLETLAIAKLALHTSYSAAGGNEVVGGAPAYARIAVTFAAATGGQKALTGAPYTFNVPATTVAWIGMWTAGNVFQGMTPNGGGTPSPFAADDIATDIIKSAGHGFVDTSALVVWAGSAARLPVGLLEGTIYYVISSTANTLQLSATQGGVAIPLTVVGNGYLQGIIPVTFAAQDTFPVTALTLDATVAA
jgi:hypothetical protein